MTVEWPQRFPQFSPRERNHVPCSHHKSSFRAAAVHLRKKMSPKSFLFCVVFDLYFTFTEEIPNWKARFLQFLLLINPHQPHLLGVTTLIHPAGSARE